jgi:hypothetical protein
VLVIDEYLAVGVLAGIWPSGLPDDDLALPASRHWRLLQRVHAPGTGQLSRLLEALPSGDLSVVRYPHPDLVQILDPRPLLVEAASLSARYNAGGLLIAETLAAGLAYGQELWFGSDRNVGRSLSRIAGDLGIEVHLAGSSSLA